MSSFVGCTAPDFSTAVVLKNGEMVSEWNFHEYIENRYALLFFYPLDFTFVCPSELIALDRRMPQFEERAVRVVAVSVDSQFTHSAWRNTPPAQGGLGPVQFTLASDLNHAISRAYGVQQVTSGVAYRASFFIDRRKQIRAQIINDLPIGRDLDEHLRLVDAIQFHEQHGEVCPAGWQAGKPGMEASTKGVADYLSRFASEL